MSGSRSRTGVRRAKGSGEKKIRRARGVRRAKGPGMIKRMAVAGFSFIRSFTLRLILHSLYGSRTHPPPTSSHCRNRLWGVRPGPYVAKFAVQGISPYTHQCRCCSEFWRVYWLKGLLSSSVTMSTIFDSIAEARALTLPLSFAHSTALGQMLYSKRGGIGCVRQR